MDWYDFMCEWEREHGEHYDIGGFSGCVELFRSSDYSLVGRFDLEQVLTFFKGLFYFSERDLPYDNRQLANELDNSKYIWRVKDSNMNDLEAKCYMYQYTLEKGIEIESR